MDQTSLSDKIKKYNDLSSIPSISSSWIFEKEGKVRSVLEVNNYTLINLLKFVETTL